MTNFDRIADNINPLLRQRINTGLVRIEDIIADRRVYGGISKSDRNIVKSLYEQALHSGIDKSDAIYNIESLIQEIITPVTTSRSITPPKPTGTAPMTAQAITPPSPAANVQIGQQSSSTQTTTLNPKDLEKSINDRLQDPKFGQDFATLLAKVMQKGM